MPDETALVRHWTLLKLLAARSQGVTVEQMAREMAVNVKTIRRDLIAFKTVGFPLEENAGKHGRKSWKLAADAIPALSFAIDEALSLYLARRFLEPLAGTYFWESLQSALRKVRATFGEKTLEYVDESIDKLHPAAAPLADYGAKAEIIDQLMIALEDRKMIHITYTSARSTESATRDVYPYGIVWSRGSLYLVAHAPEHNEIRHYKIDRIDEVAVSVVSFEPSADFNLEKHLAGSFGIYSGKEIVRIQVRFARAVGQYLSEKTWPGQRSRKSLPDGNVLMEFELNATAEFKSWILSFGPNAEILKPQSFRDEVADDLRRARLCYDKPPSDGDGITKTDKVARAKPKHGAAQKVTDTAAARRPK